MTDVAPIVEVDKLHKVFRLGFFRRRVEAVRDVSFTVAPREIFGLIGPNGAGKTTTIKMMMGLIFPTAGQARIFGQPISSTAARQRLGFLPENPYFYDYLTGAELLDLMGRLFGIERKERQRRARALLERVGLTAAGALEMPLRKYSKGMLQRLGVAQALINDPELVVLDEPMSGLDPIGRREIRDLIASLRDEGKTVVFSTHILGDVELLCDRVAILVGGRLRDVGRLEDLLSPRLLGTEIVIARAGASEVARLPPDADVAAELSRRLAAGEQILSVTPQREKLEDLFVREVESGDTGAGASAQARQAN